jgi:hypothetical protein
MVSPEGVTTDPEKLEAVQCWQQPGYKHELRSFLGLCTNKRRWICQKPLTQLNEEKWTYQ